VEPAAQVVDPVYPVPPHWPYLGMRAPVTAEVVAAELLVLEVDVISVVDVAGLVVVPLPDPEVVTTTPPGPATPVVREPDST
jgi:hypothetical protein